MMKMVLHHLTVVVCWKAVTFSTKANIFLASIASIMSVKPAVTSDDGNALILDCEALLCAYRGQRCCTMLHGGIWRQLQQSTAAVMAELFSAFCH